MAGNIFNLETGPDALMDVVMSVVLIAEVVLFFTFFAVGALAVLWKLIKKSKWGMSKAWVRGDKRVKKSKKLSMRRRFDLAFQVDRYALRRTGIPLKKGEEDEDVNVMYNRNVLFMSDDLSGGGVLAEENTELQVMVNPLQLKKMRDAIAEQERLKKEKEAAELKERRDKLERERKAAEEEEERQRLAEERYQRAYADALSKKDQLLASQMKANLAEIELGRTKTGPRFEALDPILIAVPSDSTNTQAIPTATARVPTQRVDSTLTISDVLAADASARAAAPGATPAATTTTVTAPTTTPADASTAAVPTLSPSDSPATSPVVTPTTSGDASVPAVPAAAAPAAGAPAGQVVDIARAAVRHEFAPTKAGGRPGRGKTRKVDDDD